MTRQPTPDIMGDLLGPAAKRELIPLDKLRVDGGTQMRAGLNEATVQEYVEEFRKHHAWGPFPPVVLFYDGTDYWVADGFHRIEAYRRECGHPPSMPVHADIRAGSRRDAILFAAGANANHGLRRTNADKRRSVETLLRDDEWAAWSDHEISRLCAVDPKTVGNIRKELAATMEIPQSTVRKTSDGRTVETAKIGRKVDDATEDTWRMPGIGARVMRQEAMAAGADLDPWAVAVNTPGSRQLRSDALARAIMPWIGEYRDAYGRNWQDLVQFGNPSHSNSTFWGDIGKECTRRTVRVDEDTLKLAIKQAFSWMLADAPKTQTDEPERRVCLRCGTVFPKGNCPQCGSTSFQWAHSEEEANRLSQRSAQPAPAADEAAHQVAVLTPDRDARAVDTADVAFGMAKAPTRNERIDALLHVFQNAVDALPEVGELTGQYTVTSALLREINKVMAILKTNKIGGYKANE